MMELNSMIMTSLIIIIKMDLLNYLLTYYYHQWLPEWLRVTCTL